MLDGEALNEKELAEVQREEETREPTPAGAPSIAKKIL